MSACLHTPAGVLGGGTLEPGVAGLVRWPRAEPFGGMERPSAVIGDIEPGDHVGIVAGSRSSGPLDWAGAIVCGGVRAGERVLVLSDPGVTPWGVPSYNLPVERSLMREGRVAVLSVHELLLRGGRFDGNTALAIVDAEIEATRVRGYSGLRILSDLGWALHPGGRWQKLLAFEERLHALVRDRPATLVCRFAPHVLEADCLPRLLRTHPRWLGAHVESATTPFSADF